MLTRICQILQRAGRGADELAVLVRLGSRLARRSGFLGAYLGATVAIFLVLLEQKELLVLAIFLQLLCQRDELHFLLFEQGVLGLDQLCAVLKLNIFVLE